MNGQFVYDIPFNTTLENSISNNLDILAGANWAVGLGYKFDDRFSVEARYYTPRDLLAIYSAWCSDYKTFSVIVGYTLF